jgi:predicted Zn finger-like uncharacterized protein
VKLSCPSCGAKYSIADEKVQDRLAKIRCRKCSATIIVDGKVDPPNVYTSEGGSVSQSAPLDAGDGGAGPAPGEYSVDFGDNDQRTMTADDIVQAYRRGQLTADTYVWTEGMADWQPVGSVPELAEALTATAAAAAPAAAPRAARTGSGRGSATDLFGGIDKAGSEEDVMTSAPQPAAAPAPALATGARNESSVLFSLSALTASGPIAGAAPSRASAASTDSRGEDSGLIDLKALTSAAGSLPPPNPLALGAAPLGMAAPLGGMTAPALAADGPSQRGGGSKTGIYIAAALVLVGALIAGAIVMTAGNRDAASAANAAVTTPIAAQAPMPTAAPEPEAKKEEPTAQAPATGTAVAEATPKDAPTKQASAPKAVSHKPKASSGSSSSGSTAAAAEKAEKPAVAEKPAAASSDTGSAEKKKPVKKEKTCNCGPGDLMCAMKCAAS